MNIITDIVSQLTINNSWILLLIILGAKIVVGGIDHLRTNDFSVSILFTKAFEDITQFIVVYSFYGMAYFSNITLLYGFAQLLTAIVIGIEVNKTYEIWKRKASDAGLSLPNEGGTPNEPTTI